MHAVGAKQTEQKIVGDCDKLLPEGFAPIKWFIGIHTMSHLSIQSNGMSLVVFACLLSRLQPD